ncbi:MAG: branched-chain amino acid ABC transporter permease [Bacillota bacterium]|nr:branched-chain amino acid ABC transporter permease [Bacillota bacterium]MDD3297937.1 branched-chain amino acid ABC transporter permease [Bacillota bacterium]MDD3850595.1 branched-chain amino acid ABC transporter permease [Bacillota bacterium]MDD4707383.1 branched-chain amino acid ABC transporter permease [Bacillota bacterium]
MKEKQTCLQSASAQTAIKRKNPLAQLIDRLYVLFDDKKVRYGVLAVAVAALIYLPINSSMYITEVMTTFWFNVVVCLGLNIIVGFAGLLSLGYAAFFAVGAYTTGILILHYGISFWLTLPVSVVMAIIAGLAIGAPTLKLRSDYLAIVTLGFGEIIRLAARNMEITGRATGLVGISRPSFFGIAMLRIDHFYYSFLVLAILAIFVSYRLQDSRLGRAWKCIREDEDAAEAMGINVVAVRLLAFIIGSVFGALAGSFMAIKMTAISPESFLFTQSVMILLAVVLGGMGKIPGVILGAFVVVIFPEVFRGIGMYRMLIFGVVLLALMIYRPQGLWPERNT